MGETLGLLGLGCMRLPSLPAEGGGPGCHGGRLDQEAVNAMIDYAIAGVMRARHPELTPAGNALTFVGSLPNVMITLSGMSNMEQLKENVSIFTDFEPFDQKEMDFMQTVAKL